MSQEEIRKNIEASSNKLILRRQMELLAEYSRTQGTDQIPECSAMMVKVHRELSRIDRESKFTALAFLGACFSLLYGVCVKLVKLRQGK